MRRVPALLTVLILAVGALQIPPSTSAAHTSSPYFPPDPVAGTTAWPFGSMSVYFTTSFPNLQVWRDRVQEAHLNWPQSLGRPPVYFAMGGAWSTNSCLHADNVNGVHRGALPTGWAASVSNCRAVGHWNFQMTFSTAHTFWPNNSDPPSNQMDLEAVGTHEFGHAYGWVGPHWDDGGPSPLCTFGLDRHTMCAATVIGWLRQRTPETHDQHTMAAAF
jgi:hypothetical protein